METSRLIDYGIESDELMQLVVQGVARGNDVAVAGWDERLRSPQEKLEIGRFQLNQTETQMSRTGTSNKDPSGSVSEDLTIPSYQFSDQCFSIDLQKSCSSVDLRSQTRKEASHQDAKVVPEVETRISSDKMTMLNSKNSGNKPVFNPLYKAPEDWLNEASLLEGSNRYDGMKLGQKEENGKTNGYGGSRPPAGIKEHGVKSVSSIHDHFLF